MNEQLTPTRVALKWGAFLGLSLILITSAMYLTGQTSNMWFNVLTLVTMVACLALAMREYKVSTGGYIAFGEGFGMGALLSAVAGLISAAFITFYNVFIDPSIQQRAFAQAREQLEEQGKLSDEQIDQALEFSQKFQSPGFTFIAGVFGTLIIGALLSLIIAAVIRRDKANPFD
ncbi:DUF4199 domain-containing protein [Spirosoma agri]|jgi:uncharacterized membrane protein|uniref:DUF4199 domain-containing protein n=1 Tax=Spirosoma agri TaxID=1987381 RepID=A0A6M0IL85_9BACT|nr:DUF4199 domain-containing protein [Spirosoma agri]NEU69060.1 DUF4199 domain-containing protein [Spirosoma agri]